MTQTPLATQPPPPTEYFPPPPVESAAAKPAIQSSADWQERQPVVLDGSTVQAPAPPPAGYLPSVAVLPPPPPRVSGVTDGSDVVVVTAPQQVTSQVPPQVTTQLAPQAAPHVAVQALPQSAPAEPQAPLEVSDKEEEPKEALTPTPAASEQESESEEEEDESEESEEESKEESEKKSQKQSDGISELAASPFSGFWRGTEVTAESSTAASSAAASSAAAMSAVASSAVASSAAAQVPSPQGLTAPQRKNWASETSSNDEQMGSDTEGSKSQSEVDEAEDAREQSKIAEESLRGPQNRMVEETIRDEHGMTGVRLSSISATRAVYTQLLIYRYQTLRDAGGRYVEEYLNKEQAAKVLKQLYTDFCSEPAIMQYANSIYDQRRPNDFLQRQLKSKWRAAMTRRYGGHVWLKIIITLGDIPDDIRPIVRRHMYWADTGRAEDGESYPQLYDGTGGVAHKKSATVLAHDAFQAAVAHRKKVDAAYWAAKDWWTDQWSSLVRDAKQKEQEAWAAWVSAKRLAATRAIPDGVDVILSEWKALHPTPTLVSPLGRMFL